MMVLVSACVLGIDCKYNGTNNLNKKVLEFLKERGCFAACCPELLGGLSIPRGPFEIEGGSGKNVVAGKARVISIKGDDVTLAFLAGAQRTLEIARINGVKAAVLKSRSPSCGIGRIYDGTFSGTLIEGDGVTAALLRAEGIELISDEEIDKLART